MKRKNRIISILSKYFNILDVSYSNDTCPSLLINDKYLLFLPISDKRSVEQCKFYSLILDEEYAFDKTFNLISNNLSPIINYIKSHE